MKKSRRDLLKLGAMAGAGLVVPKFASAQTVNTRVHTQGGV
ncbi:MAG: twin-arginine translocation signal domain-containing protein, partial [Candidatus Angelobacter sp.]